jgi:hypothetical protein
LAPFQSPIKFTSINFGCGILVVPSDTSFVDSVVAALLSVVLLVGTLAEDIEGGAVVVVVGVGGVGRPSSPLVFTAVSNITSTE